MRFRSSVACLFLVFTTTGCSSSQNIVNTNPANDSASSSAAWSTYSDTMNSVQFSVRYPSEWSADYDRHAIRFGDRGIIDFGDAPMGLESDIVADSTVTLDNLPFERKAFGDKKTGRMGNIFYSLKIDSPDSPLRNVKLPFTFGIIGVQMPSDNNDQYVKLVDEALESLHIQR